MRIPKIARLASLVVAAAFLLMSTAVQAVPQSGTYLEIENNSGGQGQIIKLSLAADRMRMDTGEGISLINIGGEGGKMMMVQHAQRQYMEFTSEMMEAMAAMAGQMPQDMEHEAEAGVPPTFTRTGNTKMVGAWNAYEVRVEHPEQDDEMIMWMSQDVDADFSALVQQIMDSMSSLLNSPMMQMGGGGGAGDFQDFQRQMASVDMPDGFPVQIVTGDNTNTLLAIDQSASFGADTWEAPAGYTKMDMPFIR